MEDPGNSVVQMHKSYDDAGSSSVSHNNRSHQHPWQDTCFLYNALNVRIFHKDFLWLNGACEPFGILLFFRSLLLTFPVLR